MDVADAQPIGAKRRRVTASSLRTPPLHRAILPNAAPSSGTSPPQREILSNAVVSKSALPHFGAVPAAVASQQQATRVPLAKRFVMPPPPPVKAAHCGATKRPPPPPPPKVAAPYDTQEATDGTNELYAEIDRLMQLPCFASSSSKVQREQWRSIPTKVHRQHAAQQVQAPTRQVPRAVCRRFAPVTSARRPRELGLQSQIRRVIPAAVVATSRRSDEADGGAENGPFAEPHITVESRGGYSSETENSASRDAWSGQWHGVNSYEQQEGVWLDASSPLAEEHSSKTPVWDSWASECSDGIESWDNEPDPGGCANSLASSDICDGDEKYSACRDPLAKAVVSITPAASPISEWRNSWQDSNMDGSKGSGDGGHGADSDESIDRMVLEYIECHGIDETARRALLDLPLGEQLKVIKTHPSGHNPSAHVIILTKQARTTQRSAPSVIVRPPVRPMGIVVQPDGMMALSPNFNSAQPTGAVAGGANRASLSGVPRTLRIVPKPKPTTVVPTAAGEIAARSRNTFPSVVLPQPKQQSKLLPEVENAASRQVLRPHFRSRNAAANIDGLEVSSVDCGYAQVIPSDLPPSRGLIKEVLQKQDEKQQQQQQVQQYQQHEGQQPQRGGKRNPERDRCYFFDRGKCVRGDSCRFQHIRNYATPLPQRQVEDLKPAPSEFSWRRAERGGGAFAALAIAAPPSAQLVRGNTPLSVYGDFIQLWVTGKGGRRYALELSPSNDFATVRCPHDCGVLRLCTTGKARGYLGLSWQYELQNGSFTVPIEFSLDLNPSARDTVSMMCPRCHRHLEVSLMCEDGDRTGGPRGMGGAVGYAYVACLWADYSACETLAKYVIQAAVLGHSLQKHCKVKKRILLVTKGVMDMSGAHLLHAFWSVKEIDHVHVAPARLTRCEDRFCGTFTKMRALQLTMFEKIVVLDLDMIVLKNCDDIFAWPAPAAVHRGNSGAIPGLRDSKTMFDRDGERRGGINAGVMLLKPDQQVFRRAEKELGDPSHPSIRAETAPEQEYITELYMATGWQTLPVKYNWQPKQMVHLVGRMGPGEDCERRMPIDEIYIVHFSGVVGPHDYLFDAGYRDFGDFLNNKLMPSYGQAYESDYASMQEAAYRWFKGYEKTWQDLIALVGPGSATTSRCPLCGARAIDIEHSFFMCPDVQHMRVKWQSELSQVPLGLRESLLSPREFAASLRFVDAVYRARVRHPELDEAADLEQTPWLSIEDKRNSDSAVVVGRKLRHGGRKGNGKCTSRRGGRLVKRPERQHVPIGEKRSLRHNDAIGAPPAGKLPLLTELTPPPGPPPQKMFQAGVIVPKKAKSITFPKRRQASARDGSII